jgi:hypothetical protein
MPDVSNLTEDGQLPPAFDHVAIVEGDRVQAPGTLMRDPREIPQNIHREQRQVTQPMSDRASDKFAIVSLNADQSRAWQLLPASRNRKSALVSCFNGPIFLGTQEAISNIVGQNYAVNLLPPNVFVLPASTVLGTPALFAFEYTSKQGLYVCGASATTAQVQCFVDMFDSGTPIT